MGAVNMAIVHGISDVVYDLEMEEKYQRAAMRALENGLRFVGEQFSAYVGEGAGAVNGDTAGGSTEGPADPGFWEPPRFTDAVCCMEGMECFTGEFANAAGRAKLIKDIANL